MASVKYQLTTPMSALLSRLAIVESGVELNFLIRQVVFQWRVIWKKGNVD